VLAEAELVVEAPELAKDKRERWWRLAAPGTRWSRHDFADDTAAVAAATAAEALNFQRQVERTRDWMANAESAPEWDEVSFVTQHWLKLSPAELGELADELVKLLMRWTDRSAPDDGVTREPVFLYARGFPAQP
jgi:hypothetical protein